MTKDEILDTLKDGISEFAKEQAVSFLKSVSTDELTTLVNEAIKNITDPLEEEISTTDSIWVKIRDKFYITVINNSVNTIVENIQSGLNELTTSSDDTAKTDTTAATSETTTTETASGTTETTTTNA